MPSPRASARRPCQPGASSSPEDAATAEIVKNSPHEGMQDFTSSLIELIEKELVEPRVAYTQASNVDELKMRLKGISTSGAAGIHVE